MAQNNYYYALGRRKRSTARVRIQKGNGNIIINSKPINDYFSASKSIINKILEPFILLDIFNKYDVSVLASGGGQDGQAEAIRLAISKAIVTMNDDYKGTLKKSNLLSRDSRDKERKKFGLKGARKQRQFTKR